MTDTYDIAIIGGGVNGAGIARDAAGRGLSVYLCERNDLASATSSWSTKLIHGGLRYLEHYKFRLVRESLLEREVLWAIAPHIIEPLRFVLPHHRGLRPAWLLRLGLFIYDHLGGRKLLPPTRTLDLSRDEAGAPLKPGVFVKGFEYSDGRVDDSRLVILNAVDAAERGATIRTRTKAVKAARSPGGWRLTVEDRASGRRETIAARILVNAAGPWVTDVLHKVARARAGANIRLVQGSHIVVRRLFSHDRAYIFQNADGRIIFAIPYQQDFTLIGTTDRDYQGDAGAVAISEAETDYLLAAAAEYFAIAPTRADIVWTYSGCRPLYDDGASAAQEATRDYVLELDESGGAPLLSAFGGKITTYRRLAEAALDRLEKHLPEAARAKRGWTGKAPLPGGDFPVQERVGAVARLRAAYPFLAEAHAVRLVRLYGTRARILLGDAKCAAELGRDFGATLTEAELRYLVAHEWARTAEDVLWRRTKLGLWMGRAEAEAMARALDEMRAVAE
jgi:glycerol-3-phosphate dehydrogenase